jgi:hypothetical protein
LTGKILPALAGSQWQEASVASKLYSMVAGVTQGPWLSGDDHLNGVYGNHSSADACGAIADGLLADHPDCKNRWPATPCASNCASAGEVT